MKKLISILLILSITCALCPVCFADGNGCFCEINIENNSSIRITESECVYGSIIFGGVHSGGAGKYLTMRVMDETDGSIYAMNEAESVQNGNFTFIFGLRSEAHGKTLTAYIDGGDGTQQTKITFIYECDCSANRETLKSDITEIESLIALCEAENISVEYEKVNLGVIKRFEGFLDGYIAKNLIKEYGHNYSVIVKLTQETKEALNGYLKNTRAEKIAPIYVSSNVTEDGKSLIATVNLKGEMVVQPVFFNGYGHWGDAVSDYASFADLGVNYTHFEVGPNSILKPGTEGRKYDVNSAEVERIKNIFKTAEENNVSIMFMTSMHYFPQFIYENNPEINNNGEGKFPDFMPYNPTHPAVVEAIDAFLNAIIPEIKDYKSFHSVCLSNEPLFISYEYQDYYLTAYRNFLEKKYNYDINALRSSYGFLYSWTTFDSITMPDDPANNARYNDWREFNDSILTGWFTSLKGIVDKIDESIPVHTKCSAYISAGGSGNRRVFCGTNYEQWSRIMDINGCDAWAIYGEKASNVQAKTMWYDFMTSMKNAPVINSEDHILRDGSEIVYNEDELKFNMADMWQGAIHGRAGSVYWLWDKSARAAEGTYYYNANLTRRADHVAAIGKINLDLNRLANEITAIQKKDARCAVLYSSYTQVTKSQLHTAAMYEAYKYLQNNGEKVYIVNDTYPEKLNENKNLELLIVPACQYMPQKVWQEIDKFIDSGKTVIFAEYNNSYYNENGKALDQVLKNSVLNNSVRATFGAWDQGSVTLSGCENVYNAIGNVISGYTRDYSIESTNGETEWTAAEYGNSYVINLCNYGSDETKITVSQYGEIYDGEIFDLTENSEISNNFTLKPYETKLIRVEGLKEGMTFLNMAGAEISEPEAGKIYSNVNVPLTANASFIHMLAVYRADNSFDRLVKFPGMTGENGRAMSKLDVELTKEEVEAGYTLKSFLFDNTNNLMPYVNAAVLDKK